MSIILRVDDSSCLLKLKSITVLIFDFLTMNVSFLLSVMFNLRTFSQVLAAVIKLFQCSILYFEMYINSLNVECKI